MIALYWQLFKSGARASWGIYTVELTPAIVLGSILPRAILQASFFVMMAHAAGGERLAQFALVGNTVHAAVLPAIVMIAILVEQEKWGYTLPYLIASPSPWFPVLLGRSISVLGDALLRASLVWIVLVPVLELEVKTLDLLRAIPILLLVLVSTSALGWIAGAISLPLRNGTLVGNTVAYLMIALGGVNFEVQHLPPLIQQISFFIPMTNGLLAIRAVLAGAGYSDVQPLLVKEAMLALVYGVMAWLCFNERLHSARDRANFELL